MNKDILRSLVRSLIKPPFDFYIQFEPTLTSIHCSYKSLFSFSIARYHNSPDAFLSFSHPSFILTDRDIAAFPSIEPLSEVLNPTTLRTLTTVLESYIYSVSNQHSDV